MVGLRGRVEPGVNPGRTGHCDPGIRGSQEHPLATFLQATNPGKGNPVHIAEGFLPAAHAIAWTVVSTPFVVHGARDAVRAIREEPQNRLLLAAAGAVVFVLSAIKLPSFTGSSSHPTGTGLGAVLFRPPVMALIAAIVLLFQALLLAHGGLTTLGANVFAFGIVGPWIAWCCWRLARRLGWSRAVGVFLAMAVGNLATYVVTATQFALAFPDPVGGFVASLAKFMGVFAITQLPLAIAEGLFGVLTLNILASVARPELVRLGVLRDDDAQPGVV